MTHQDPIKDPSRDPEGFEHIYVIGTHRVEHIDVIGSKRETRKGHSKRSSRRRYGLREQLQDLDWRGEG